MRRAVAVIRVSKVGSREGDSFASPSTQLERIRAACDAQGLELVADPCEELNVSGGAQLDQRPGLGPAVAAIEAGEADVLVAAYFDRFFRNLEVQAQVIRRVEAAGGEVFAVDMGRVSRKTPGMFLTSGIAGLVSEYHRLVSGEKSSEALQRAIDRGVPPWPHVTPGYTREPDSKYTPDPDRAPIVLGAFERRAQAHTLRDIQAFMRAHGFPTMGFKAVQNLLATRVVRGEIHFGSFKPNLAAHDPIVPEDVWQAAQAVKIPRGRHSKSERLLARTGVLRCANCDGSLVVGSSKNGQYWNYRCTPTSACTDRVAISAPAVEALVATAVRERLRDESGRASAETHVAEAEHAAHAARDRLGRAIQTLDGFEDVPGTRERLLELRRESEEAEAHLAQVMPLRARIVVNADVDWERLSLHEKRDLIRATVARVVVGKGRGLDRVTIEFFGE